MTSLKADPGGTAAFVGRGPTYAYELQASRENGTGMLVARCLTYVQLPSIVRKLGYRADVCRVVRLRTGEVEQVWRRVDGKWGRES